MKTLISVICRLSLACILLTVSCKDDDEEPIPLAANAGTDINATIGSTVTLDGSQSTGPENFSYVWSYVGGAASSINDLSFSSTSSQKPTFIPPSNGVYTFSLRVEYNGMFSEDQVTVTISGALTLPASISSSFSFENVEPDPTKPDYLVTGLVTVSGSGNVSSPITTGIVIEFADNASIHIQGGSVNLSGVKLTSTAGWKGILLSGGNLSFESFAELVKAGKSAHDGQSETASIVMTGGSLALKGTAFTSSMGTYDLLMAGGSLTDDLVTNTFAASKPIKAGIQHVSRIQLGNTMPSSYQYILLTTPGASTQIGSSAGLGFYFYGYKYLIDGDFTVGSDLVIYSNAQLFMKAGAGILQSTGSFTSTGCLDCVPSTGPVIDGLNSAPWKGIAIGAGATGSLSDIEIKNAGSGVFNTGSFTSSVPAAVYYESNNGNGLLDDSAITSSGGYGVYSSGVGTYMIVRETSFTGTSNAGISAPVHLIHQVVGAGNTYAMTGNIPAVEVRSPNILNYQPLGSWLALGGSNFYLMTGSVQMDGGSWTLAAGTNLKFKPGKSLSIRGGTFTATGTANSPIVLDSEAGTPGTWPGIILESPYTMEYCQVKNGGEIYLFRNGLVTPATEIANVVFNYSGGITNTFKNNTITGSGGYGILVEAGKQNPDAGNPANANAFSANTSGNIIVK
jgi:hypothetical protein